MNKAVPLSRYVLFFSLAIGLCAADLATKSWAFAQFGLPWQNGNIHWLWKGWFGFQTSLNTGGLWGLGQGYSLLLAALAICAAVGIVVWLFPFGAAKDRLLTVALGLVTAGILGNLYDRLGLPGLKWPAGYPGQQAGGTIHAVRDFLVMIEVGRWHWPNFNLADCSLVSGAVLLVWHTLFAKAEGSGVRDEG